MVATVVCVTAGLAIVVGLIVGMKVHPVLALVAATVAVLALTPAANRREARRDVWVSSQLRSVPMTRRTPAVIDALRRKAAESDASDPDAATIGRELSTALAATAGKLALPIVFASVIGACLLHCGAAAVVADRLVSAAGPRRVPPAMSATSFFLSIPIYFDSVFYLLLPLARAASERSGPDAGDEAGRRPPPGGYLLMVLSVVVGGTMAHSLVPPTPGPLMVAEQLSVPVGKMILGGSMLGVCTASVGLAYAFWISRRMRIEPPSVDDVSSFDDDSSVEGSPAERPGGTSHAGPPLIVACLPILLPLALLSTHGVWTQIDPSVADAGWVAATGDYTLVLGLAAATSIAVHRRYRGGNRSTADVVSAAVADAGVIVLLTAAGGAFGASLRDAGVGLLLGDVVAGSASTGSVTTTGPVTTTVLPLAFGVTVFMRAAQGSATVAMLTAAAIVAPLVQRGLTFDPIYLALAIGCGSKPLAWMNDSGFWLVGRLSGMTVGETLRTFSAVLTLMGLAGFAIVWTLASVLPGV